MKLIKIQFLEVPIIKTKTYKTLIHLETVRMFMLNRSDRIGLRANYS